MTPSRAAVAARARCGPDRARRARCHRLAVLARRSERRPPRGASSSTSASERTPNATCVMPACFSGTSSSTPVPGDAFALSIKLSSTPAGSARWSPARRGNGPSLRSRSTGRTRAHAGDPRHGCRCGQRRGDRETWAHGLGAGTVYADAVAFALVVGLAALARGCCSGFGGGLAGNLLLAARLRMALLVTRLRAEVRRRHAATRRQLSHVVLRGSPLENMSEILQVLRELAAGLPCCFPCRPLRRPPCALVTNAARLGN